MDFLLKQALVTIYEALEDLKGEALVEAADVLLDFVAVCLEDEE